MTGLRRELSVAFGPEMPGFGSWEWVGAETARELAKYFDVVTFRDSIPSCDVVVFVKFHPPIDHIRLLPGKTRVVYAPIDIYGSAADIDADAGFLLRCDRIVVHCERLRKYFSSYAPVSYIDHHLRHTAPPRILFCEKGPILWVGVPTNLPPLVEWANHHALPEELWVLTNPEGGSRSQTPQHYGFSTTNNVRIETWTPARHLAWTEHARGALDIKGDDFRARHKPPAKALDFLASNLPLAMHGHTSSAEHVMQLGFPLAEPEDFDRWLSRAYWDELSQFATLVRESLPLSRIGHAWKNLLQRVYADKCAHMCGFEQL